MVQFSRPLTPIPRFMFAKKSTSSISSRESYHELIYKCRLLELMTVGLNVGQHKFNLISESRDKYEESKSFNDIVLKIQKSENANGQFLFCEINHSLDENWGDPLFYNDLIQMNAIDTFVAFCDIRKKFFDLGAEHLKEFDESATFNLLTNESLNSHTKSRTLCAFEGASFIDITSSHILTSLGFTKGRHLQIESFSEKFLTELNDKLHRNFLEVIVEYQGLTLDEMKELFRKKFVLSVDQFSMLELEDKVITMQKKKFRGSYSHALNKLFHMEMMDVIAKYSRCVNDEYIESILQSLHKDFGTLENFMVSDFMDEIDFMKAEITSVNRKFKQSQSDYVNISQQVLQEVEKQKSEVDKLKARLKNELLNNIEEAAKYRSRLCQKIDFMRRKNDLSEQELNETKKQLNETIEKSSKLAETSNFLIKSLEKEIGELRGKRSRTARDELKAKHVEIDRLSGLIRSLFEENNKLIELNALLEQGNKMMILELDTTKLQMRLTNGILEDYIMYEIENENDLDDGDPPMAEG